jgi:hypothetical protein
LSANERWLLAGRKGPLSRPAAKAEVGSGCGSFSDAVRSVTL